MTFFQIFCAQKCLFLAPSGDYFLVQESDESSLIGEAAIVATLLSDGQDLSTILSKDVRTFFLILGALKIV